MALLAIEWDGREVRVAAGRQRGAEIVLDHAFAVDLEPTGDPGETFADPNVGERLAAALAARGLGRCDTLAAVGRSRIELRSLTLPPSPVEELPDLVRFQALREFTTISEDWPIDFVHLMTGDDESLSVLAAAISPELVKQIRETCEAAGQTPQRLILRPFAAVSLLRRRLRDDRCRLMVDMLAEEADLTVIADGQLAFMRTVRLPHSDGDSARQNTALLGEVRRTMVAAQNQLGGRRVERIVLCGGEQEHEELRNVIAERLELPVDVFDPLAGIRLGSELTGNLPRNPGRFAPLIGMLVDEAAGTAHAIDFLHPRKKPPPQSNRRLYALAGAAAAVFVLGVFGIGYLKYAALGAELAELESENARLEKQAQIAIGLIDDAKKVEEWSNSDIVWLDELHELSRDFPSADEAIIADLSAAALVSGGGRYGIEGAVVDPKTITKIDVDLRDAGHQIQGAGGATDQKIEGYNWQFKKLITVKPASERPPGDDAPPAGVAPPESPASQKPPADDDSDENSPADDAAADADAGETP